MSKERSLLPLENAGLLLDGKRRLSAAFRNAKPAVYAPQASLVRAGERVSHAVRLESGWAARERMLDDGRCAIVALYLPGDVIGLDGLFGAWASDSVIALAPTVCNALPLTDMARLMEQDPALSMRVAFILDLERRRAEALAAALGRCDAAQRIGAFLLDVYDRLRANELVNGRSFRLPLTQQQIGDHLGLTVVHVNRVLRHLREEGIAIIRRSTAIIADLNGLRRLAEKAAPQPVEPLRGKSRSAPRSLIIADPAVPAITPKLEEQVSEHRG